MILPFPSDLPPETSRRSRLRTPRGCLPRLRLTVVEGSQDVIKNLANLPDPIILEPNESSSSSSPSSSCRRSPKKESPILENRKPGRPRTKPESPGMKKNIEDNAGLTKFKQKSAEWKAAEVFKCTICKKVLSCRGSFERHTRTHEGSRPYKCSYCPKTFNEGCKKAVHERVHSGSKPFPCKQCKKSFRTATQRNVHMSSHTKEKPHTCDVCGKMFSQAYSIKVHKQKFHN